MTTELSLDTTRDADGSTVLVATGEIDLSNVTAFGAALSDAISDTAENTPVTVDLSAVGYLDSGAISVLFERVERVRVIANPLLIPVLHISGLAEMTSVQAPPAPK